MNGEIRSLVSQLEAILHRIIVDDTQLKARYDWELSFDQDRPEALMDVLREQLGLALVPGRRPVEVLVIELVEVR